MGGAAEFTAHSVRLAAGEVVPMQLAERGTRLPNALWVREIRKVAADGHRTSIPVTNFRSPMTTLAVPMFARWSQ